MNWRPVLAKQTTITEVLRENHGGRWKYNRHGGMWECDDGRRTARRVIMCTCDDTCGCGSEIMVYGGISAKRLWEKSK